MVASFRSGRNQPAFGPGFNGPFELVATLHGSADRAAFAQVVQATAREPGVVAVTPLRVSPSGNAAVALVYPDSAPQAAQTARLLGQLRSHVVPAAEDGRDLNVLIGGATPAQVDFSKSLASKLPLFVAVVVILAFLLLMLVFRSLVIPLMASVMNLLSVGAALGVMNAVFNWGWGSSALGLRGGAPVEVFLPVIMFSVLFGLSMDYEVFLVSRIREEWDRTGDNRVAVTRGQALTGRVITAAATIMILVFLSFLLGAEHHHPAVRDRPGRGDHHRRLRGAYRAGAGPHAPVRPGQLVAAGLAGPRAAHPAGRGRQPGTKVASVPPRPRDRGHPSAGDAVTRWR